jgi:hypothetical protein
MTIVMTSIAVAVAVVAVVLGVVGERNLRRAARLGVSPSRAAKLQPGFRKVKGRIQGGGKPLRSPVTNKPCVYFKFRVDQEQKKWRRRGGTAGAGGWWIYMGYPFMFGFAGVWALRYMAYVASTRTSQLESSTAVWSWEKVLEDAHGLNLRVEDETGEVDVDMEGAEVVVKDKALFRSSDRQAPPHHLQEVLHDLYDVWTVNDRGLFKNMNFYEEVLTEGSRVTVVGPVAAREDGTLCFDAGAGPLLVSDGDVGRLARSARMFGVWLSAAAAGSLAFGLGALFMIAFFGG